MEHVKQQGQNEVCQHKTILQNFQRTNSVTKFIRTRLGARFFFQKKPHKKQEKTVQVHLVGFTESLFWENTKNYSVDFQMSGKLEQSGVHTNKNIEKLVAF